MREKNQVVLQLNLGICISEGDFVFKVAEICESLDYAELFNTCVRKWRRVNPITLFEMVVFGYMEHLHSGRDIAKACKTDISKEVRSNRVGGDVNNIGMEAISGTVLR